MLPLSLLLLLATSRSPLVSASIPPDPFSHPKYSLSFLNDLPIEHSQAQRWIANGLPSSESSTAGGVDVFFGAVEAISAVERMELDEKEEVEEVEKLVVGEEEGEGGVELDASLSSLSGDELEQINLSPPSAPPSDVLDSSSPPSTSPPTSNYTLQHLLLPPGPRSYLCLLPPPPQPLSALPPPPPVPPMDPALPEKLLSHLSGGCLYVSIDRTSPPRQSRPRDSSLFFFFVESSRSSKDGSRTPTAMDRRFDSSEPLLLPGLLFPEVTSQRSTPT